MKHKSFGGVSFNRHEQLTRAVGAVVDASLRQLTAVNLSLPDERNDKTNPMQLSRPLAASQTGTSRRLGFAKPQAAGRADLSSSGVKSVDASLPQLTPVNPSLPRARNDETNPTRAAGQLSPRQLAAARLLARGRSVANVAQEVGVSRQALWKWRQQPGFDAEIRRVHEVMVGMAIG